jgi:hypothetical protein
VRGSAHSGFDCARRRGAIGGIPGFVLNPHRLRTFTTRRSRRFDAYMVYDPTRARIVDYLGTHQHLAVDLDVSVDERCGLRFVSGEQRFYEGLLAFRFPLMFSGVADVHEWYDDTAQQFRIDVRATNRFWGPLFGHHGHFQVASTDRHAHHPAEEHEAEVCRLGIRRFRRKRAAIQRAHQQDGDRGSSDDACSRQHYGLHSVQGQWVCVRPHATALSSRPQ